MLGTVVLVGRPNVGKSTLFNRLIQRRAAIIKDIPGVTRDRREGDGKLGDLNFRVIDTAGLEDLNGESLESRIMQQTKLAIHHADTVLFLIDGRAGVTPTDQHISKLMHESGKKTILILSKCEGSAGDSTIPDAWSLGFGTPIPISAEHAEGLGDLYEALLSNFNEIYTNDVENSETIQKKSQLSPLRIAIVGRPNVGKSTLLNRIVGEERVITGPESGLTRDSISVEWNFKGRRVMLVDTAGLRRRSRIVDGLEKLSAADSRRSIEKSEVVIIMFDGSLEPSKQVFSIAALAINEGRAPIVVLNKWDSVQNPKLQLKNYKELITRTLSQAKGISVIPISALSGSGVELLIPSVIKVHNCWNQRVATSALNRWLAETLDNHPPPLSAGRRIRLRYITQVKSRPPTFALFCNLPGELPESYSRYLVNNLRERFSLPGIPIRLNLKKGQNPYVQK